MDHDKYARAALEAYATACEKEMPLVAEELRFRLSTKFTDPVLKGIQDRMRDLSRLAPPIETKPTPPAPEKMSRGEEISKMFSGEIKKKRGRPKKVR